MRKKRVLLLSEGFGSGHTQAAHAISVGLRKLSSGVMTRVLELGAFQHPTIAPLIFSAYRKTVTSKPHLYGKLYRQSSKKSLNRVMSMALHRIFYSGTAGIIRQLRPDMIVCTHPFPNVVVSRLKRAGLTVPLCTVITDYDAHGTWINPEVDRYLVSTEAVKSKLIAHGVAADHIIVTGIPVHPNFWADEPNKAEIRARFGLKEMPTALIMGGGWGLIKNDELLQHVTKWRDRIQLIFCMGSNEKARLKLAEDERFKHPNVHLLGFTKEIDKLMDISDVLVTKPGGMTSTEGMAKGIPMLFYSPIPGQEEENIHYFIDSGFGEELETPEAIDIWFERLLNEYPELVGRQRIFLRQEAQRYSPQQASQAIMALLQ